MHCALCQTPIICLPQANAHHYNQEESEVYEDATTLKKLVHKSAKAIEKELAKQEAAELKKKEAAELKKKQKPMKISLKLGKKEPVPDTADAKKPKKTSAKLAAKKDGGAPKDAASPIKKAPPKRTKKDAVPPRVVKPPIPQIDLKKIFAECKKLAAGEAKECADLAAKLFQTVSGKNQGSAYFEKVPIPKDYDTVEARLAKDVYVSAALCAASEWSIVWTRGRGGAAQRVHGRKRETVVGQTLEDKGRSLPPRFLGGRARAQSREATRNE